MKNSTTAKYTLLALILLTTMACTLPSSQAWARKNIAPQGECLWLALDFNCKLYGANWSKPFNQELEGGYRECQTNLKTGRTFCGRTFYTFQEHSCGFGEFDTPRGCRNSVGNW